MIVREELIAFMANTLQKREEVFALWLEGSDGLSCADAYSDLDFWLDVEDGREEAVLDICESLFRSMGTLDFCQYCRHPHPKIFQRNMHIAGTSPYWMLDVCVQSHSRGREGCTFMEGDAAEFPRVLFDKTGVIRIVPPAEPDMESVCTVIREQEELFFQRCRVDKYLKRRLFLEAFAYYKKYVCEPVLALARLLYMPRHADYGLVHVSVHLPSEAVEQLERLYKAGSLEDIRAGCFLADRLFEEWKREVRRQYGIV